VSWLFLVVAAVAVFAVAAAFVGSEAFRLGHAPQATIFDLDEAVDAVGDGLPEATQGRLTYDEVRTLIMATLEHLRAKGLTALPGEELPGPVRETEVVVADDDVVAVVLGAVEAQGLEVDDEDAYEVIRALLAHLDRIGALGPRA